MHELAPAKVPVRPQYRWDPCLCRGAPHDVLQLRTHPFEAAYDPGHGGWRIWSTLRDRWYREV